MAFVAPAIPFIVMGLTAVTAGVGAYAAIQQGKAAKKSADYEAEIMGAQAKAQDNQAQVVEQNAAIAQDQARFESDRIRSRYRKVISSQKSAYSKGGVTLTGSADDVMYDSILSGELDALAAEYQGEVEAYNYKADANMIRSNANVTRAGASNARMAGRNAQSQAGFSAATSILGGVTSGFATYDRYYGETKPRKATFAD